MIKVVWFDDSIEFFSISSLSDYDYEVLLLYSNWKELHVVKECVGNE